MPTPRIRATQTFEPLSGPFVLHESTRNEWLIRIKDAIHGDEPTFRVPLTTGSKAKKTVRDVTLDEVCRAGFRELNEGRGTLILTEIREGAVVYQAIVQAVPGWSVRGGRQGMGAVPIFRPLWSTDRDRTKAGLPFHVPPARFRRAS